jgi:hypothetical protein
MGLDVPVYGEFFIRINALWGVRRARAAEEKDYKAGLHQCVEMQVAVGRIIR